MTEREKFFNDVKGLGKQVNAAALQRQLIAMRFAEKSNKMQTYSESISAVELNSFKRFRNISEMIEHVTGVKPNEANSEALPAFNPDSEVVISKSELEALQALKSNSDIITTMAKQVEQLHKLQTGGLFDVDKVKKKLTPKEKRELEENERKIRVQQMRNEANLRALGNL